MRFLLLICCVLLFVSAQYGYADKQPSEYTLKAAFLYNFAKFIHWPDDAFATPDSPLVFGVLGDNPFPQELASLAQRRVHNRPILIRKFTTSDDIDCHMLFINTESQAQLESVLASLAQQPIVTVGDVENFISAGGAIQFITKREHLRFAVNLRVPKSQRIRFEAKLLALAVEVME